MDPNDAHVCQDSIDLLAGQEEQFVDALYAEVFKRSPDIRALFEADIDQFSVRQSIMLRMAVELLDAPNALGPKLRALGKAHAVRGVKDRHYSVVEEALVTVLSGLLLGEWRPEFENAWRSLVRYVAREMITGATKHAA